jgi:hypothetical protein
LRGIEYALVTENGKTSLLRYDGKHKVWVKLNFRDESVPNSVVETLTELYIRENA